MNENSGGGVQLDLFGLFAPEEKKSVGQAFLPVPVSGTGKNVEDAKNGTGKNACPTLPPPAASPPSTELLFVRSHRARHYRLTLRRDGAAVVTIPARGSEREARRFAAGHADWLARARKRQEKRPRSDGVWGIGTQILWRGEMARIGIAPESTAGRPMVALVREGTLAQGAAVSRPPDEAQPRKNECAESSKSNQGALRASGGLETAAPSFRVASLTANLRPALEAHFLRVAKIELPARAWELAAEVGVPVTAVRVRNQRARWGSCTSKGVISLNWRLVQAPEFVRDYIIYHELMHLREMNHSARFWKRVGEVCPFWQDAERWIKKNGGLLGL